MYIKPIQPLQWINELSEVSDKTDEITFKSVFDNVLNNYIDAENKVDEDIHKLSVGESDDLHNLMINAKKAEVSLDLVLQLRTKALDAYNEILRISV